MASNLMQLSGGNGDGRALLAATEVFSGHESLPAQRCLELYRIMVRSRIMEERMIKMSKSGQGYFWIGGPGEEAFNVCLGLQIKKGHGPAYDFLHLHYRNSATLVAMGMPVIDAVRQMAMTATDIHSRGRNFVGHFAMSEWNIVPISSVIEDQFVVAPGTALVQKRHGGEGITIVVGGESGSAEGDFASCLVWSTRPGNELPILILTMNNGWGISTPACSQHAPSHISDRGKAFGIPAEVVDGNDPIASWHAIHRAMDYVRHEKRPYMLEAMVSRLYGHSSSSGAQRVAGEADCVELFEEKLTDAGILSHEEVEETYDKAQEETEAALEQTLKEPRPAPQDIYLHTYAPSKVDAVYPGDYTGLPQ
jgi:2-oxoisovalerate dehydrogenase E1 component alpha subunit